MMPFSLSDTTRVRLHGLFASALFLFIGFGVFGPSGQDDPYITFGSARELAQFHHLANINGEPVESGSSVLHIALLAISHQLSGISLPLLGLAFSVLFAVVCFPLTQALAKRCDLPSAITPCYFLALSTAFTYWAMGSLETTLAAACVLALVYSFTLWLDDNNTTAKGICLLMSAAFVVTRPEGFFVLCAFFIACGVVLPNVRKPLATLFITASCVFASACLLRLHFFQQAFPQPVYAKADSFHLGKLIHGLLYFLISSQLSLIIYAGLACLPIVHFIRHRRNSPTGIMLASCFCLAGLAFIVVSGGDWMGGGRFFVPYLPLFVILACFSISKSQKPKRWLYLLFLFSCTELMSFSELQATGMPLWKMPAFIDNMQPDAHWEQYHFTETGNHIHANDIIMIEAMEPIIATALQTQSRVTISGVQMGMIPYFLRDTFQQRVYFVDMRGLTTQHITACADFAHAKRLWTGIFVDYGDYFQAQKNNTCLLPNIDIVYELQNLNPADTDLRMQALASAGYHVVYRQNTLIKGGLMQRKLMNTPYFIAVSDKLFQQLPAKLHYREVLASNVSSTFSDSPSP